MKNSLFLILCLFFTSQSLAESFIVNQIQIEGNNRTQKDVILDEIGFKEGTKVSEDQIKDSQQKLKNLNLFSFAQVRKSKTNNDVIITLKEKWTTIPVLKFSSGGDVNQTTVGVYDPNVFGRLTELGAQYQKLEDTDSGVVWFKKPRLNGEKQGLNFQLWKIDRLRTKYFQQPDDPIVKTGFLQKKQKIYFAYNRYLSEKLNLEGAYEYNYDEFSSELIPLEARDTVSSEGLPPSTKVHFLGAHINYGEVFHDQFLKQGDTLRLSLRRGFSEGASTKDFLQFDLSNEYFKILGKRHQLAIRTLIGATDTNILQFWYYLGGLDRIRGFADNRFSGKYAWLNNSEFRYYLWGNENFVFQTVAFLDLINTAERIKNFTSMNGASTGLGLRVTLPKFYRFILRLDYAEPLKKNDDNHVSFGVQQFF
ncbi:MAG: POTRA domain-containing protein [Bacteriovoracaceae bacterium]